MISHARTRRATTAVAALVLGLTAAATAAPASADTRTLKDGRGDTWNVTQDVPTKQGGHPEGDLRKVVIKHTARKLVVTSRFQNLKKAGQGVGAYANIDVPGDVSYGAGVFGTPGAWKGQTSFYASDGTTCEPSRRMNYRTDVARLSVPTRCLGRPDWVRLQVYGQFAPNQDKYFIDSAHGVKLDSQYTRRIERG